MNHQSHQIPRLTESKLQELYEAHLAKRRAEGFSAYRAHFLAENDLNTIELNEFAETATNPIQIMIAGIGNCQYTGD